MSELPGGSADPVELAARVEDGKKTNIFISNKIFLFFLKSYLSRI